MSERHQPGSGHVSVCKPPVRRRLRGVDLLCSDL